MARKRTRKVKSVPKVSRRGAIPPLKDPAEAVERIVPRRLLKVEDGDVLIVRTAAGFRVGQRDVYELRDRSGGVPTERFASFERAAAAGEQIATSRRSRLFYADSEYESPHLLSDFRER
jgi:hypothetical protein